MESNAFKCRLVDQKMLTSTVLQLTFERVDGRPLRFLPGQFVTFLLPNGDGPWVRRSYSISNSPEAASARFEIAVAPVAGGFATQRLFGLAVGDELLATGPTGRFVLQETAAFAHCLFVATGTGIAPYRSMLPTLARRLEEEPTLRATVLLGVRYAEEVLYAAEFLGLAQQCDRFGFLACLSREAAAHLSHCRKGYVQAAFPELNLNPATHLVYLCGNPQMVDAGVVQLRAMGFPAKSVVCEKYISKRVAPVR